MKNKDIACRVKEMRELIGMTPEQVATTIAIQIGRAHV